MPRISNYDLPGCPLAVLKDRSCVEVVNRPTIFTPIHFQFACASVPKLAGLPQAFLALRALETFWMKIVEYPLNTIFIVK